MREFDQEEQEEMDEQIEMLIRTTKSTIKGMDEEFHQLQAENAMRAYNAYQKVGFTAQHCFDLVVASMKAIK